MINLLQFLETTRKNGLVLNKPKLQFKKQEVHFFEHQWNSHGITPDPKKIDSIHRHCIITRLCLCTAACQLLC